MTHKTEIKAKIDGVDAALKTALCRQSAPEGFADQVLARIAAQNLAQPPERRNSWFSLFMQPILTQPIFIQPVVRWAALAAFATAMIFGVYIYNIRREHAQGEAAKKQLMLALRVAGSKLQLAKSKVNDMNTDPTRHVKE